MKHNFIILILSTLLISSCALTPSEYSSSSFTCENEFSYLDNNDIKEFLEYQYTENDIQYIRKGIKETRTTSSYSINKPITNTRTIYYDQENKYFIWFSLICLTETPIMGYAYIKDDYGEGGSGIYNPATHEGEFYFSKKKDFSIYEDNSIKEKEKNKFFDIQVKNNDYFVFEWQLHSNYYYLQNINARNEMSNYLNNIESLSEKSYKINDFYYFCFEVLEKNITTDQPNNFNVIKIDKITEYTFEFHNQYLTKKETKVKYLNYLSTDTLHPVETQISIDSRHYEYDVDCYFEIEPVGDEYNYSPYASSEEP